MVRSKASIPRNLTEDRGLFFWKAAYSREDKLQKCHTIQRPISETVKSM
jgi:hypothetical protein